MITLLFPLLGLAAPQIALLHAPEGWTVNLYATVPNARSLTRGPGNVVFVGTKDGGSVFALVPVGDKVEARKIAEGLEEPNGVAFKNGDLYIAQISQVGIIRGIGKKLDQVSKPEAWGPLFPSTTHHGWKFIAFGPDGWLYVPEGAPCNVCEKDPDIFGALFRISPNGKNREVVARGIRNTVGFDWDPANKQLWFTDNGRDMLGDDLPPDELNHVTKMGQHFGFPYCHGGSILDPDFGKGKSCGHYEAPEFLFPAHVASLGMRFLRHERAILVAEHGSWNRSSKVGYQVERVDLGANGKATGRRSFLTGFLQGEKAWGRPVDVLELDDGSVLVSDDEAGAVYKVAKTK
jgi:glucose/arabinose dehydrogenase